jgi:hypothetical protein
LRKNIFSKQLLEAEEFKFGTTSAVKDMTEEITDMKFRRQQMILDAQKSHIKSVFI